MFEERQAFEFEGSSLFSPSKYWSDFCSYFDYMFALPEEYFTKLRLHTYHITGDNYQRYYFGNSDDFMSAKDLFELTKGIPSEYVINEPESGIGFHYGGDRFVSRDTVGCQIVINTFYRNNVLSRLKGNSEQRCHILDIGAGYGALAHHLSNICGNCTYIIVDLPETLLFSGSYLSLLNPQKKIYFYCKNDFQEFIRSKAIGSYDFVLVPNYRLYSLVDLQFDLVISVASLQEMREDQVVMYLDFVQRTCKGVFYSSNRDRQPRNSELSNLSVLLRQRFELNEVAENIEKMVEPKQKIRGIIKRLRSHVGRSINIAKRDERYSDLPYREYMCKPIKNNP
jgi:SAM-dependent methyltransferase